MKRLVSSVLTLAMIFSLAGCSKKSEETTKKTKDKNKSETESEETVPPESDEDETKETDETDETDDSTISESDESTKASQSGSASPSEYTISPDFSIRSDLKTLDYTITENTRAYGFVASPADGIVNKIIKDVDLLTINESDTYDQLWNSLDGIYPAMNTDYDSMYDQLLPSYVDGSASDSFTVKSNTYVARADSEVFSFVTCQEVYDKANNSSSTVYRTYNYRSADSMEYNLNDLISDRGGFANFFAEYFHDALKFKAQEAREVEYLAGLISDPDENVPFLLTYDGIIFVYTEDYVFNMYKIPAVYAGDYFDMSLFGATPENYVLVSDAYDHIIWDVDDDGDLDDICAVTEKDEYDSLISLGISVNGRVEQLPKSELQYSYMGLYQFYFVKTDDGVYIYAELYRESSEAVVAVFKFDGSTFTFQSSFIGNLPNVHTGGFFYDPANFTVTNYSDIMGSGYVIDRVSAMGNDGMPKKTVNMGRRNQIAATRKEITVNKFDSNGAADGTATLPENAVFNVIGIDLDSRTLLCEYLDADETKNFFFELQADPAQSDSDWSIKYNGIDQDELFMGFYYAG